MAAPSNPFPLQSDSIKFGQDVMYRLIDNLLSEGVIADGDGIVTQNGGGAMQVNIAAGEAIVAFDTPYGGKRQLRWTATNTGLPGSPNTADNVISTFTAANGSNPRIDRVVTTVQDASLDATGQRRQVFQVIAGTATAGADLVNLTGAASVPANSILLANVLVRAAATTILTADIDTTISTTRQKAGMGNTGARVLVPTPFVALADSVLTTAGNFDFSSIPATFRHLLLIATLRGNQAASNNPLLRFNNDSGTNYSHNLRTNGNAASITAGQTSLSPGTAPATGTTAGFASHLVIDIPNYAGVVFHKGAFIHHYVQAHEGSSGVSYELDGAWQSTSAINRVALTNSAGLWITGSRATLYGMA